MKKYYTTEDLATGNVILKFKKKEARTLAIIHEAFKEDVNAQGISSLDFEDKGDLFYNNPIDSNRLGHPYLFWGVYFQGMDGVPQVSEKYILLPGESIPEKGFTWDSLLDEYYDSKDHGPFSEYLKRNFKCNVKRL